LTKRPFARPAGFIADCLGIANRSIRAVPREIEFVVPALVVPVFFYTINIGALGPLAEANTGLDFKAFQLPVAIIFAVTGLSRASALVTDIQNGYFDRLLMTPIRRLSLLLGLMMADLILIITLSIPWSHGIHRRRPLRDRDPRPDLRLDGGAVGLAFTGFRYAIALKTGNRRPSTRASSVLPLRSSPRRSCRSIPQRVAPDDRQVEPGDVPAGEHALVVVRRLGPRHRVGSWRCDRGHGEHDARVHRAAGSLERG
jgi:hypothetical protein